MLAFFLDTVICFFCCLAVSLYHIVYPSLLLPVFLKGMEIYFSQLSHKMLLLLAV